MNLNMILFAIGAALALIIVAVILWLSVANAHLKSEVAIVQNARAACLFANDGMRQKIQRQNKAIADWQNAQTARAAKAAQALKQAQSNAAFWMRQADDWLKTRMTGDDCVTAHKIVQDYLASNRQGTRP